MKDAKKDIVASLKTLRPGQVLMAIAKQYGEDPAKFLVSHFAKIGKEAVESGKAKMEDIGKAMKSFSKKNHADETGIDWEQTEVDPATLQFGGLLLGKDSAKKTAAMEAALEKAIEKAKAKAEKKEAKQKGGE